jgi:hypothetical protein
MIEAELPDGRILEFPVGTSPDVIQKAVKGMLAPQPTPPKPTRGDLWKKELEAVVAPLGNLAAGAVRGAGSIGATILAPVDAAARAMGIENSVIGRTDRRQAMDQVLQDMGADPDSFMYQGGKLGTEIAGTAGVGGVLAKGLTKVAPGARALAESLRTGGFSGGNLATRAAAGGAVGGTSAALINTEDAGLGTGIGAALPVVGRGISAAGSMVSPERLMQSALKPTLAQQKSGEAKAAIDTLLKYGINATQGGADKLKGMVQGVDQEITDLIAGSNKQVTQKDVLKSLDDVRGKFSSQVNPEADLSAIQRVGDEFSNIDLFSGFGKDKALAQNALDKAISEKQTALQAAGKLQTFAAQQKSLADGATFRLAKNQPENQLYYNTGGLGRDVTSPSSLPVPGFPRFPGRYTNNIQRVPEGLEGADEAMAIYAAKKAEEAAAEKALSELVAKGPTMSVQDAQRLKQGTYKVLEKKYGQLGSAETEAQKALARGLKEQIAQAVPEVAPLNAKQSELIKALKVTGRRAMMDDNRNPVGIAGLSTNPSQLAAMLADRSALLKSLAARGANQVRSANDTALVEALRQGVYRGAPVMAAD